mmetsp:Transcript_14944/g.32383  ORF Transcript_14944/g.32383 Transcript_14944/m.32383 type:complete len:175 (-) Transcript_14944:812-1336(-)
MGCAASSTAGPNSAQGPRPNSKTHDEQHSRTKSHDEEAKPTRTLSTSSRANSVTKRHGISRSSSKTSRVVSRTPSGLEGRRGFVPLRSRRATGDQADIPHPSTQPAAQQQEGVQLHLVAAALEKLGEAQSSNSQDRDSSPQGDSTEHARESGLPEAPIEPAAEVQESGSGPPAA